MLKRRLFSAIACVLLLSSHADAAPPRAKNVILFIGDGMGITTVTAARIRAGQLRGQSGEESSLSFEGFPHVALSKTYTVDHQVGESAGTMTAMMTGVKTKSGSLSVDANGHLLTTLLEIAEGRGLSTGVVTTTRITHATPAACYGHSVRRDAELDLARQLVESSAGDGLEVALGGGRSQFLSTDAADLEEPGAKGARSDGRDLTREWSAKRGRSVYVWNAAQFDAVVPGGVDHLLGLFAPSHMSYENDRGADRAGEPSLAAMTEKAVAILSKNRRGYFLMVEGGRIDHSHHDGNAYRALGETIEFARAVEVAMRGTRQDDTLIIVTADHSHTLTMSGYPVRGNPILGKAVEPGEAVDGAGLPYTTLNYANGPGYRATRPDLRQVDTTSPGYLQEAAFPLASETHGGEDVPVYARGPGSERVAGVIEQNVIFDVMMKALQWSSQKRSR